MNNTHTLVTVRVRRVIKTYPENKKPKTDHGLIKKNDKIVISYDGRLCDKVRTRSKYIFTVNSYQMQGNGVIFSAEPAYWVKGKGNIPLKNVNANFVSMRQNNLTVFQTEFQICKFEILEDDIHNNL